MYLAYGFLHLLEGVDKLKQNKNKSIIIYILVSIIIITGLVYLLNNVNKKNEEVDYSTITGYFNDLKVSEDILMTSRYLSLRLTLEQESLPINLSVRLKKRNTQYQVQQRFTTSYLMISMIIK